MEQNKKFTKAISGVLVGGMLLTFGGIAIAENSKGAESLEGKFAPFGKFMKHSKGMHKGGFGVINQETLDLLVKEGTITQKKADEIKTFLDKKAQERKAQWEEFKNLTPEERKAQFEQKGAKKFQKTDLFNELVDNKILTQEQTDAIQTKLKELMEQRHQQNLDEKFKALVEKGTITQAQADQVKAKLLAAHKEREALFEKIKGMTPEERKEFMEKNQALKENFKNPLRALVEDGTISEDQAKEMKKLMFHKGHKKGWR